MRNMWMIYYGLAHIFQGLLLIASLGFFNYPIVAKVSLAYARWQMNRRA